MASNAAHAALLSRIARLENERRELAIAHERARAAATENVQRHALASLRPRRTLALVGWFVVLALTLASCARMTGSPGRKVPALSSAGGGPETTGARAAEQVRS